ncbi:MAG: transglycosylase domain-containing protein [Spirochaetes bacterium]|nr:transglycosylase domain-containing protein [Spirochaetota bacterium]MBU1081421.1 transglycosylase domain-containing protein [Spirochaetota bacterium]
MRRPPRWLPTLALGVSAVALALWLGLRYSPYPELEAFLGRPYSLRVLDRSGRELYVGTVDDGRRRQFMELGSLPPWLPALFIEAEDKRFYFHPGVDPLAVARSAWQALIAGKAVSGASTISMQLARIVSPRGRSIRSKAMEALDALRLETRLGKRRALELYLSNLPYGRGAEGLGSAARAYFSKAADDLNIYEAAILAVLPRNPGRLDPIGEPEALAAAALRAFRRSSSYREDPEAFEAMVRETIAASRAGAYPSRAPHFVRDVVLPMAEAARDGAWNVRSTIDLDLQGILERTIASKIEGMDDARLKNGAGLVLDPRSGDILAWSGSVDFDDPAGGQIDGVLTRNQPGSCLKPFLYALALDSGFKPSDPLPDVPMDFGSSRVYVPLNFNNRYNGPVRLRVALASSLNVPAVYVLNRLGVQRFADYLEALGFDSVAAQRDHLGVGLALGNAEVSLEELTRAYAAFVRDGSPLETRAVLPGLGESEAERRKAEPLMSLYAAETIRSILSDPASRFLGFGEGSVFKTDYQAMFKTGTANQYQHVWAVGATGGHIVGVWMGNFEGDTVIGTRGSSVPAEAVRGVLDAVTEAGSRLPAPAHGVSMRVCNLSGGLAGPECPASSDEWFRVGEKPVACGWHVAGPAGARLLYPPEYRAWLLEGFRSGDTSIGGEAAILRPKDGAVFWIDPAKPLSDQRIAVELLGATLRGVSLAYDDRPLSPNLEGGILLVPERGDHTLVLSREGVPLESVRFTVE